LVEHLIFSHMMQRPEEEIDLAAAALLIAEEEYPGLDVAAYVSRLDRLAAGVRRRLPPRASSEEPAAAILALNGHLFEDEGFHGNQTDYYDPRNNFLNEVLDRKTGIPITLSIVYMEVARRIGFLLHGVGFPGHFLVKYQGPRSTIVIDPFFQGRTLDADDLRQMLSAIHGRTVPLEDRHLNPVGTKQILVRVLHNLRSVYTDRGDARRVMSAIDRILILDPEDEQALKDRDEIGMVEKRAN
jgi:regulator of sirC expression with transglutaminase-like and TPR domain